MKNSKNWFAQTIILILSMLLSSGCKSLNIHGNFVSDDEIKEIKEKKPTKNELEHIIASPTYIPDYTLNTWYYLQRTVVTRAWFNPTVTQQRIVKITFDDNKVSDVLLIKDSYDKNIVVNSSYTRTRGTELNNVQKFVKNIGRFRGSNNSSKRKKKDS